MHQIVPSATFDHCIDFNPLSLGRQFERQWTAAFKPFGLTAPRASMLRAVIDRPGQLRDELAEALKIAPATAARGLAGLSRLGFIERRHGCGG